MMPFRTMDNPSPDTRRIVFSALAFLFGAAALGALFGIGLVIGWFDTDEGGIHRVHDLGFGIVYGVLVAAAFFALIRRPETKPSVLLQIVVTAVAVAVAALISTDLGYLVIAAALLVVSAILLALLPRRDEILHPKIDPSPVMAGLVVLGAIPLVWFGATAARMQRDGSPLDPHVQMSHWTTMASMAFAVVAVGLLASARIQGWRFTAWCAGLAVSVYGLASIVFHRFPGAQVPYAGSEGIGWGLLALIGGLAFIVLAEGEARRTRSQLPDPS
jgi:uncharacterized membrane protein